MTSSMSNRPRCNTIGASSTGLPARQTRRTSILQRVDCTSEMKTKSVTTVQLSNMISSRSSEGLVWSAKEMMTAELARHSSVGCTTNHVRHLSFDHPLSYVPQSITAVYLQCSVNTLHQTSEQSSGIKTLQLLLSYTNWCSLICKLHCTENTRCRFEQTTK